MISREQVYELVAELRPRTCTSLRENQREVVPYILTDSDWFPNADGEYHKKKSKICPVRRFHYKDSYYTNRWSAYYPEETTGILRVENLPFKSMTVYLKKK